MKPAKPITLQLKLSPKSLRNIISYKLTVSMPFAMTLVRKSSVKTVIEYMERLTIYIISDR